jgi:elongation factor 1-alpha
MIKIVWKISRETGNKKALNPANIKANEMAEVIFQPQQPFVVDCFKNCEGLGRIAILEGATVVMLGKVVDVVVDEGKAAALVKGKEVSDKGSVTKPASKTPAKK